MLRVEAAIFASPKPVAREALVRLVGEACRFDDLIADLIHELRGRPYDLTLVAGGYALRTKTRFAPAIRAAHPGLGRDDVAELTRTETFALTAIAYLQPVTRGEISKLAGREISRDVIASLKRHGLIDGAIRAPQPGAPFAYVTTRKFLEAFGFASLRDLPDLEQLEAEVRCKQGRGRMISIARLGWLKRSRIAWRIMTGFSANGPPPPIMGALVRIPPGAPFFHHSRTKLGTPSDGMSASGG